MAVVFYDDRFAISVFPIPSFNPIRFLWNDSVLFLFHLYSAWNVSPVLSSLASIDAIVPTIYVSEVSPLIVRYSSRLL